MSTRRQDGSALARAVPNPRGYRDVTALAVHETIGSARIVDVREPREYSGDLGHIAQSFLVPLAELAGAAERWDRHGPIVLVCRSGSRSAIGAETLLGLGFDAVMNMTGGMLAWVEQGLPTEQ